MVVFIMKIKKVVRLIKKRTLVTSPTNDIIRHYAVIRS